MPTLSRKWLKRRCCSYAYLLNKCFEYHRVNAPWDRHVAYKWTASLENTSGTIPRGWLAAYLEFGIQKAVFSGSYWRKHVSVLFRAGYSHVADVEESLKQLRFHGCKSGGDGGGTVRVDVANIFCRLFHIKRTHTQLFYCRNRRFHIVCLSMPNACSVRCKIRDNISHCVGDSFFVPWFATFLEIEVRHRTIVN